VRSGAARAGSIISAISLRRQKGPLFFRGANGRCSRFCGERIIRTLVRCRGLNPELIGKWTALLKDAAPSLNRAALLYNPKINRLAMRGRPTY
jgi:hypothetical protein